MLPTIRLSISDRTCCAWQVSFAFPFPKDHAAVVAQASCRWGHRTSCPVFQTPQATYPLLKIQQVRRPLSPLLKIQQVRRPLSPQTRCRGYHYNCERKG